MNVIRMVQEQFEKHSSQVFAVDPKADKAYTYEEFYELSLRSASLLRSKDLKSGDRVGLMLPNSVEFASLYFGCLFSGVVTVPISHVLHERDVTYIKSLASVRTVLDSEAIKNLNDQSILTENWIQNSVDEQLLSITFTSGTTSKPKGVVHKASSLFDNARSFNEMMHFDSNSRFFHVMPMTYMAGLLNTLLCPFMAGGSVVFEDAFGPMSALRFWENAIKYEANAFWLAPTMLAALMRGDRSAEGVEYSKNKIRSICVGTAPLSPKLKIDFEEKYQTKLYESYGLSELLFVSTNEPNSGDLNGSVGKVLPEVKIKLNDEGEILISTPHRMVGYLNEDSVADKESSPEWFASGDIGTQDPEGYLSITSRKKDLIIKGGMNISPRAVEEVLETYPSIEEVAVVGLPHNFLGEEVCAAIKLREGCSLESIKESLQVHINKLLSEASRPTQFVELSELPKNANGKIQKNKIIDQILGSAQSRS